MTASLQLKRLADEIRGNPRLQSGAVLIALLVFGWLYLVLVDWRDAKHSELDDARQRLAQVRGLAGQTAWMERANEADAVAARLSAEIPEIASPGLAQAEFQSWLRTLVDAQGGTLRLDVQAPVLLERPDNVVRVSATVSGALPPARAVQLINRIEGRTELSTIPILTIRDDGRNHALSLTVQGYYRLVPTEAGR